MFRNKNNDVTYERSITQVLVRWLWWPRVSEKTEPNRKAFEAQTEMPKEQYLKSVLQFGDGLLIIS